VPADAAQARAAALRRAPARADRGRVHARALAARDAARAPSARRRVGVRARLWCGRLHHRAGPRCTAKPRAGTYVVQAFFFLALSGPLVSAAWPWQAAVSSLAACRLVLRVHHEGATREPPAFALTTIEPGLITTDDVSEW
jgi:hypothetical protein